MPWTERQTSCCECGEGSLQAEAHLPKMERGPTLRNPFNSQPLISHLTNSNRYDILLAKVADSVPVWSPNSPQPAVYFQPFDFVGPLFSYSYELFVVPNKVKAFAIKQIRTLCAKYWEWECPPPLCPPCLPGRKARLCGKPHVLSSLRPLCRLFALFSALVPFVFNRLHPLFGKHPGGGIQRAFGLMEKTRGHAGACPLHSFDQLRVDYALAPLEKLPTASASVL